MELPKLFDYTSPTQTLSVYVFITNISFSAFSRQLTRHVGLTNFKPTKKAAAKTLLIARRAVKTILKIYDRPVSSTF